MRLPGEIISTVLNFAIVHYQSSPRVQNFLNFVIFLKKKGGEAREETSQSKSKNEKVDTHSPTVGNGGNTYYSLATWVSTRKSKGYAEA